MSDTLEKSVFTPLILQIEKAISAIRGLKKEDPTVLNSPEIHALAVKGEFELRSGTGYTVGGRRPKDVGLAYSIETGLVIAPTQHLANSIAKGITLDRILAYAGILVVAPV
jgi:hypothetical protein